MTVNAAKIGSDYFLNGLAQLQARETRTRQELSSGYRIRSAADDPGATRDLVDLGSSLATAQVWETNLVNIQAEAASADSAIGSAITLVQNAQSIATQGASSTASVTTRLNLAAQIQSLQQQIVGLANTQVGNRYIFGGDLDQTPPYQYDPASVTGVDALTTAASTRQIVNPAGQTVYQSLSAGTIFDSRTNGYPNANNVFAALQTLQTALAANDSAGIAGSLDALQSASRWLNQQQAQYGIAEQRLAAEQNNVSNQITTLKTSISGLRDADVAQDATDLTQETTAQSAAIAAQAANAQKSLFDYLA